MAGLVAKCRWGDTRDLVLTFTKTCSAAENKGGQHAHLAPEGGAGLLIELGLQVATACSGWCLGTTKLARGWANHEGGSSLVLKLTSARWSCRVRLPFAWVLVIWFPTSMVALVGSACPSHGFW